MKNLKRNIDGITLIALVVTIIILLILAGITINTLTGENGILTKVVDARTKTEMAEIKERSELVKAELNMDSLSENFKALIEKNVLLSKLQEEFEGSTRNGDIITTPNKKYDIVVDNDLNITVIEHTKSSGITLVYSIEHENTSAVVLKVHPVIDDIGEEPTEEELYQKAQEAIDNLPTDETERNEAIDKMFIEYINIMIKSGFLGIPKETVITTLSDALQLIGVKENYSSFKEFYEARMSGGESFDEFVFMLQGTIEAFKYVNMITIECSNGESYVITDSEYSTITITRNGKYTITAKDENGNTGKIQVEITQLIEEKFSKIYEKTTQITSEDGKEVWIPKGFAVGISDNINKVSEGLVITDNVNEEGYSIGNEFVWVPVDSNKFQRAGGYLSGSKVSLSTSYTEPYTNGYEKETQEYEKMKSSVETNGGFYIGRYEAGKDRNGNVVVQKGVDVYTNIGWSNSNDMKNEEGGAVEKAKDFKKGKAYENSLTSTLIYGIQWDATMQFFDSRYIDGIPEENIKNSYVSNSTGMGNYSGKVAKTGISTEYSTKNIYDMAGNIWEWTMEAQNNDSRVVRGGHYNNSGSSSPVSARYNYNPSVSGVGVGFRLALYIGL